MTTAVSDDEGAGGVEGMRTISCGDDGDFFVRVIAVAGVGG